MSCFEKFILYYFRFTKFCRTMVLIFLLFMIGTIVFSKSFFPKSTYEVPVRKDILMSPSSCPSPNVKWFIKDSSIASVDSNGIVHGKKEGVTELKAVKNEHGKKENFLCTIKVVSPEPIRVLYASPCTVDVNSPVNLCAITGKDASSVKFEIKGPGVNQNIHCNHSKVSGETKIWSHSLKFHGQGNYHVNAYANISGTWKAGGEHSSSVSVTNASKNEVRHISAKGANFIASCEGSHSRVYKDSAGILTIGCGKRLWPYETFYGNMTQAEIVAWFTKSLNEGPYTKKVYGFLKENNIKFNQHQFDALVSFTYNLGVGWLKIDDDLGRILTDCGKGERAWYAKVNSDNGIFLREQPNLKGAKLKALRNNTYVDIIDIHKVNKKWYHVKTSDGKTGYCYGDYLKVDSISKGEKNLNSINKKKFINDFCLYHHYRNNGVKCSKGLLSRRFYELDMFFHNQYANLGSKPFNSSKYPIPPCAKKRLKI